jgi:hypothetical protein
MRARQAAVALRLKLVALVVLCAAGLSGCASRQTTVGSVPKAASKAPTKTTIARTAHTRSVRTQVAGPKLASDTSIPVLSPGLLERQSAPDCEFRGAPTGNPGEDTRVRLDYQQQCYRQAEAIVRTRLDTLQDSVSETIRAFKNR